MRWCVQDLSNQVFFDDLIFFVYIEKKKYQVALEKEYGCPWLQNEHFCLTTGVKGKIYNPHILNGTIDTIDSIFVYGVWIVAVVQSIRII